MDTFWTLIEQSGREAETKRSRREWLENRLRQSSTDDIIDFQKWLFLCEYQANTWELWDACAEAFFTMSNDGFLYFRLWLVGLGRETFERVIADPEALLEIPEVIALVGLGNTRSTLRWTNDEWPEFELLGYVVFKPYKERTGLELETLFEQAEALAGLGEGWDMTRGVPPGDF
jgi:hypothetical protein